jgi:nitrate reductase (cytochrome), electron transfer subunit
MRGQGAESLRGPAMRQPVKRFIVTVAIAACCITVSTALAAELMSLRGPVGIEEEVAAPPIAPDINDDQRRTRNYPEQPPVIPHQIRDYQITLNANKCLSCHSRQFVAQSQAPMISITHFMDREGQVLASVTPRRYFCTQCHVTQADIEPLIDNDFQDIDSLISSESGEQ